jgi:AAA15 family ATPase/GTPase
MLCDKKLHKKLDDYELTKFLNCHSTNLIVGKPGSGKTSMLYSFMKSKKLLAKVYDKIYLFQPEQSRQSMKDKLFDKLPDDQNLMN